MAGCFCKVIQGLSVTNCQADGSPTTSSARLLTNCCACAGKAHKACCGRLEEFCPILSGSICTRGAISEIKRSRAQSGGSGCLSGRDPADDRGTARDHERLDSM